MCIHTQTHTYISSKSVERGTELTRIYVYSRTYFLKKEKKKKIAACLSLKKKSQTLSTFPTILLWGVMHIYGHLYLLGVFALALGLANWSSRHEQIPERNTAECRF